MADFTSDTVFFSFFLHGTVLTNELFMLSSDVRTLIAFVSWSNKISFSLLKHELCINVKNEYVQEKSCKTSWESQQLPFPKKQRIGDLNDSSPNHQNVTIIYKCHWQHSNPMFKLSEADLPYWTAVRSSSISAALQKAQIFIRSCFFRPAIYDEEGFQ